jgi:hypothetical protein
VRPHRACRFRRHGAQRARGGGGGLWAGRSGRFPARHRHRHAHALAERTPERAEEFEQARRRLVGKDVNEMGGLFKAMVIANRSLPAPPGFEGTL